MGDILALSRQCHAPRRRLEDEWKRDLGQRCLRRNLSHILTENNNHIGLQFQPKLFVCLLGVERVGPSARLKGSKVQPNR